MRVSKADEIAYRGFDHLSETQAYHALKNLFDELYDWYRAMANDIRPFDLASHNLNQAIKLSAEWHKMMAGQGSGLYYTPMERDEDGLLIDERVVYYFDDGWFIMQLIDANDLKVEGNLMSHCVGSYCHDVAAGDTRIFSLRDPQNKPHGTIELAGSSNTIRQVKGFSNERLGGDEYDKVSEWLQSLDDVRWEDSAGGEADIYWGSSPEEIKYAIYDEAYGPYEDGDNEEDNYGVSRRMYEERFIENADISYLYERALEQLQEKRYNNPADNVYTDEMEEVAEALAEVAVSADIALMKNAIESSLPESARWQRGYNPEGEEDPLAKGRNWWARESKVNDLVGFAQDHMKEFYQENGIEDTTKIPRWAEEEMTGTLPYGLDLDIQIHIQQLVQDKSEYMELFRKITGLHTFQSIAVPKDYNWIAHPRLFTHRDDIGYFGDYLQRDEKGNISDPNYIGEWKLNNPVPRTAPG
jgi:hypothetical protein